MASLKLRHRFFDIYMIVGCFLLVLAFLWINNRQVETEAKVIMVYNGCDIVKANDRDTVLYFSLCSDMNTVSWQDKQGQIHHTIVRKALTTKE